MKKHLFSLLIAMVFTVVAIGQQSFRGVEAQKKIPESSMIRYKANQSFPSFIYFQHRRQKFLLLLHLVAQKVDNIFSLRVCVCIIIMERKREAERKKEKEREQREKSEREERERRKEENPF